MDKSGKVDNFGMKHEKLKCVSVYFLCCKTCNRLCFLSIFWCAFLAEHEHEHEHLFYIVEVKHFKATL